MFTLYYPMQRILYLLHVYNFTWQEGSVWPSFFVPT